MTRAVGVPPTPANWTGDNFASVLTDRTVAALGRTALLAVIAAVLLTGLGAAVAVLERLPGRSGGRHAGHRSPWCCPAPRSRWRC